MPRTLSIEVKKATYLDGYKISILFNDGKNKVVDFSDFISHNNKVALAKYKNLTTFKKFKIVDGNLVWGKDWDLIFPVWELYRGKIN